MQKQEQEGLKIELFLNSIKSKDTKGKYSSYLKKYMEITGIDTTSLLSEKDPRIVERQIIDFINKMKNEGCFCLLTLYNIHLLSHHRLSFQCRHLFPSSFL